ncbi:MAG: flagellar hook assembly protein FlgD [Thiohalobacteraceae bacterium]|nr:flagellar hook assembly protein FlgD [Gammaproteobacteria bacterium]
MTTSLTNETLSSLGLRSTQDTQATNKGTNSLSSDDFMELLLAEIQHQDPLEPMDNSEFVAQLASISQVTSSQELQKSFDDLSATLVSNQALQAAGMVGRDVLAPTGLGVLEQGGSVRGTVELPQASSEVAVKIYDGSGQMVRRLPLGGQAAGEVRYQWDGLRDDGTYAPPGTYLISAEAAFGGTNQAIEANVVNRVNGVTLGSGGALLLDLAGVGPLDFNQVKQIL